jgi:glycosyltransferase involved in cell wall biosynthesis
MARGDKQTLRILHVLASLDQEYGGPLRLVLDLSARTNPSDLESEILGVGDLNIPDNPCSPDQIHSLPLTGRGGYRYSSDLRPWLRGNLQRFEGVVIHGMWTYLNWAVASECNRARVPYVCFPHGMLEPWAVYGQGALKATKKIAYWFWREKWVCNGARALLFTTEREKELAFGMTNLKPPGVIVRPFGIHSTVPAPVAPDHADFEQRPDRKIALFLGRVHPKKNVDFLIRAWAQAGVPEDWDLVIAGSGDASYVATCQRLVNELGLREHVRFTGFVTGRDKAYLLRRSDWFLLPSKQENFGIAVLEAVEQDCAIAISDRVYIAESFRPDSEVLPLTMKDWVEFLRVRMIDQRWRSQTVALDRAKLLSRFEIGSVTHDWAATWHRLFGGPVESEHTRDETRKSRGI